MVPAADAFTGLRRVSLATFRTRLLDHDRRQHGIASRAEMRSSASASWRGLVPKLTPPVYGRSSTTAAVGVSTAGANMASSGRGLFQLGGEEVAVAVEDDGHRRMAGPHGHLVGTGPGGGPQTHRGVPEIVRT